MQADVRRRRLPRLVLVLVAVVAGLVLAIAVDVARSGGPGAWLARHHVPAPYLPLGKRVDIGGRSLYLDCRGSGTPIVVLEAGSGSDSATWSTVHDELATTTRTCAYDRAGRGRSDARPRHTLADAADDLDALLAIAGETGPRIVVGHSLGGAYARVFAANQRDDVVGLVLVDSFDADIEAASIHPLLGDLRDAYLARLDGLRAHVSAVDGLDWPTSEAQLAGASVAGLPVEVLVAPRYDPDLGEATNTAVADAWRAAYESLSPGKVRHTIAWGAGHVIQVDRPDLVIESVRRLVRASRDTTMLPP
jgi:pimeloyl-ACP methyl ester carboxylesterase